MSKVNRDLVRVNADTLGRGCVFWISNAGAKLIVDHASISGTSVIIKYTSVATGKRFTRKFKDGETVYMKPSNQ